MAFPTIPTGGRVVTGTQTGTSGTRTFPNLNTLTKNSGDLLIAICVVYQSSASAGAVFSGWGGGFTEFGDVGGSTSNMSIGAAYKWSDGTETGAFTVTQADTVTGDAAFILLSIPGAHASTPPEIGAITNGTSSAADIAALNPSGWGTEDTLWIAVGGSGETGTGGAFQGLASAPTNYGDYAGTSISQDAVGGVQAAVAFRQLNGASDDPGTFSLDTSNARNSSVLIAVRPAPANATGSADAPFTFGVVSSGTASRRGVVSFAEFQTPPVFSSTPTGAASLSLTLTVGSAGTPTAYGSSSLAATFTVGSTGTPTAYGSASEAFTFGVSSAGGSHADGAASQAFTFGVSSAGTPTAYGSADEALTFTVGSTGTPTAYGEASAEITFGVDSMYQVDVDAYGGDTYGSGIYGDVTATGSSDSAYTLTVGSAGTPTAYGSASLAVTFGVVSSGASSSRKGVVSWAAFSTPVPSGPGGSASLAITFGVGSAGTPTAYGASSSTYTVGISSSGSSGQTPRTAAGGLVYLFGDKDNVVFGSASAGFTFTVGSSGTPTAYGASSSTFTVGVSSSGAPTAYGASSSAYTLTVGASGSTTEFGSSSSVYTLGISSSGTGTPVATGSASLEVTVGIDSTPGLITAVGAASMVVNFLVGARQQGLRLIALTEDTLTLQVDEDTTLTLTLNNDDTLNLTPMTERNS